MSWRPTFWITKDDYKEAEGLLSLYTAFDFKIFRTQGIVLMAGESNQSYDNLHEIIKRFDHWILNGEGGGCDDCIGWGDKLTDYEEEQ